MSVIASNTSGATTGPDPASLARERREPSSICLHTMTWLLGMLWVRSVAHLLVTRYAELRRATLKRSNGDGSAKWFLCGRDIRPTPAIFKGKAQQSQAGEVEFLSDEESEKSGQGRNVPRSWTLWKHQFGGN